MSMQGDPGSILGSESSPGERNDYHSSILAWRIPWIEKLGELTVHGVPKSQT